MRLKLMHMVKATGLCPQTIRKYADAGYIPVTRDVNGWRIFDENSIEVARQLAGIPRRSDKKSDGK